MIVKRHEVKIGMELEGQCATREDWYPVTVLRPRANGPDLFWVRTTHPDGTTTEDLLHLAELRKPTQEKPMTERDKLLAEARELAAAIEHGQLAHLGRDDCVKLILTLALIVEQYADKPTPPTSHAKLLAEARELRYLDAEDSGTIRTLIETIKRQDTVIAETVAACNTCDWAIGQLIELEKPDLGRQPGWDAVNAARYVARNAAKLGKAEVNGEPVATRLIGAEHDVLMELMSGEVCRPPEQPPPPVAVEMRVRQIGQGALGSGYWIAGPGPLLLHSSSGDLSPRKLAEEWLAALSDQLGVPLVANWKEAE